MQLSFLWFGIMMKWHKLGIERAELSQNKLHKNDSLIPRHKYHHQISYCHQKPPHLLNPFFISLQVCKHGHTFQYKYEQQNGYSPTVG